MIGNSYGQVLHAHLLNPVSDEMTSRLEQDGQNSVAIYRTPNPATGGTKVGGSCGPKVPAKDKSIGQLASA